MFPPRLRHPPRILVLLALSGLSSCLDYQEELWLNADSSGRVEGKITMDAEAALPAGFHQPDAVESQLRAMFSSAQGAEVESYRASAEGGKRVWEFAVAFRDIRELKPALATGQHGIGAVFGDFTVAPAPDRRLAVTRTISLGHREESGEPEDLASALGRTLGGLVAEAALSGRELVYRTHFPSEVLHAGSGEKDREGRAVTWRVPLAQAVKGPVTLSAEIRRPIAWLPWAFAGFVLLTTAAVLVPALRKRA